MPISETTPAAEMMLSVEGERPHLVGPSSGLNGGTPRVADEHLRAGERKDRVVLRSIDVDPPRLAADRQDKVGVLVPRGTKDTGDRREVAHVLIIVDLVEQLLPFRSDIHARDEQVRRTDFRSTSVNCRCHL